MFINSQYFYSAQFCSFILEFESLLPIQLSAFLDKPCSLQAKNKHIHWLLWGELISTPRILTLWFRLQMPFFSTSCNTWIHLKTSLFFEVHQFSVQSHFAQFFKILGALLWKYHSPPCKLAGTTSIQQIRLRRGRLSVTCYCQWAQLPVAHVRSTTLSRESIINHRYFPGTILNSWNQWHSGDLLHCYIVFPRNLDFL